MKQRNVRSFYKIITLRNLFFAKIYKNKNEFHVVSAFPECLSKLHERYKISLIREVTSLLALVQTERTDVYRVHATTHLRASADSTSTFRAFSSLRHIKFFFILFLTFIVQIKYYITIHTPHSTAIYGDSYSKLHSIRLIHYIKGSVLYYHRNFKTAKNPNSLSRCSQLTALQDRNFVYRKI